MIRIRGYDVEVDVLAEVERYDWGKSKIRGSKYLACSPFRDERHPSFAVNLDNGTWIDSGGTDDDWKKGGFVKLLAWLRNETYEEAADYLLATYSTMYIPADNLELKFNLESENSSSQPLDKSRLDQYKFRHPYLEEKRGIEERYQLGFSVGYDRKLGAVTFPWLDKHGELVNIKFRSVTDKRFWYLAEGQYIKNHLYGMNHVIRKGSTRVFIVESEIDCITLWQSGFPAIAMGGANLTKRQKRLILQSPIETLVLATDNDEAGELIARSISEQLNGWVQIQTVDLPDEAKDVNDLSRDELVAVAEAVQEVTFNIGA